MTYPKAQKGVKIVWIAQFLSLIGSVLSAVTAVFTMIAFSSFERIASLSPFAVFLSILLPFVPVILVLIGFVLTIIGVAKASGDDENFKVALYSLLFGLVISLVSAFLMSHNSINAISSLLTTLTSYLAMVYVTQGVRNLAVKLDKPVMEQRGKRLYHFLTVLYVLETCVTVAVLIFTDTEAMIVVSALNFAVGVLSFIQSLIYLLYLQRAKKMLKDN